MERDWFPSVGTGEQDGNTSFDHIRRYALASEKIDFAYVHSMQREAFVGCIRRLLLDPTVLNYVE